MQSAALLALLVSVGGVHAQTRTSLTAAELQGSWTLTVASDQARKGFRIKMKDRSGRSVAERRLQLEVRSGRERLDGCVAHAADQATKSVPCRLDDGVLFLDIPAQGGQGGALRLRLARTGSGAIEGPATVYAARLPRPMRIGTATLARAS